MSELHKILYVEDEPDIQAIAEMSLQVVGGFEVSLCNSGDEAIEKAEGIAPDLILLDVMMPGMDEPTTLQNLRKISSLDAVPIVFMTAKAMSSEIEELKALGAVDVIPKPFDPMELPDRIRAIWTAHKG